jgi:signal transduction histidine kinase
VLGPTYSRAHQLYMARLRAAGREIRKRGDVLNRAPISVKVFIAPAMIITLMLGVILISQLALSRQQTAFLRVVGGPLTTSTTTTTLLLGVAELQSDVLRYAQLQQRVQAGDRVLVDLRRSIIARYDAVDKLFDKVRSTSEAGEVSAVANISDFLTIHRGVATKILDGRATGTIAVSTLMAHYQQLQSYIVELAARSLETAQTLQAETAEYIKSFSRHLIFWSIAIVAVSVTLTTYVGRAISIPISNLISILSLIAAGKLSVAIPGMQRRDEIGAMARAVNVFALVTKELRNREQSLMEARALAETANQLKSQFLANMSHELRTPLAAILGYAELLKEGTYGILPEKSKPIIGRIQSNGTHLLGLINTVLDLSKIEAGQFSLNLSEYGLDSMVENVRVATESLAQGKQLTLKTDVARELPHGVGDEQRLTQVLLNLVGNAIKFTDVGEVRIAAGVNGDRFTVAVTDTGPGIPANELHKIFEEFHQVDNSNTKRKGGTGLGLAIAKQIVEMHGGRIWVESSLGKGSTFRIELPVRAAAAGGAA